jgi:large subunit ribosomal protein L6
MSRIGKKPINIPAGVEVSISANVVTVKGPKGTLSFAFRREVDIALTEKEITVEKKGSTKLAQALWGTTAKMMTNMCEGVTNGFQKQVELNGVGYRMAIAGNKVTLALGFSHPVEVTVPNGLEVTIEGNIMTVKGIDKQSVGQFAAIVRKLKPVEPYKGKGFRYVGETVRRKEGKKAS